MDFPKRTLIMGIVNVTPDSFSDGGTYNTVENAVRHAKQLVKDGADILDIGGESTRPGSEPVSEREELQRVLPVIEQLTKLGVEISIDTTKPGVADACLHAGATILNDVTGLTNNDMLEVAKKHGCPVVVMHMQGKPKTMQENPTYKDLIQDIKTFFQQQKEKAPELQLIFDPGIGFGKTLEHNLELHRKLSEFTDLGPILFGSSRKSFIEHITKLPVEDRLEASIASNVIAVMHGASIIRVHDVKEHKKAIAIADAVQYG
ncbi:MAG: dihydropteroate synthase [Candidatus Woesearchaeota archaeon]|nr:dihydropteroate synthase [Candidatus Woesearchaeota archaeon]